MSDLRDHVALVTGAARGQGRSHAARLAADGADIIAIDICDNIDSTDYPLGSKADLDETCEIVRSHGRRVVALKRDIRDAEQLQADVTAAVAQLGRLDIVIANAGILTYGEGNPLSRFRDAIDVNLVGTWNTLEATVPHIQRGGRGGSIILTGSTNGTSGKSSEMSAGSRAYTASKHAIIGLMRSYALALGSESIRVNVVSPTGVNTPMVSLGGDSSIAERVAALPWDMSNVLPVPLIDTQDVSAAVSWLVSDAARFVTGVVLPVDAGYALK